MSGDEFDIIRRFFRERVPPREDVILGIGDDGAVIRSSGEPLAWVVDTVNAGIHFPHEAPGRAVGHRALAVNLSDLVAMGGEPRWALLSLTLPEADEAWLADFCAGFFELAERAGIRLVGGDLTRGPLAVTVTVLGPLFGEPVRRDRARVGDEILVSGTLGDARAGLDIALGDGSPADVAEARLLDRYLYPEPRLGLAPLLARHAHAAVDLSDGLCSDLGHILRESGRGARLELAQLPLSEALRAHAPEEASWLALAGGDDYEILCCVSPEQTSGLVDAAARFGIPMTRIGTICEAPGLVVTDAAGEAVPLPEGFSHFGADDD